MSANELHEMNGFGLSSRRRFLQLATASTMAGCACSSLAWGADESNPGSVDSPEGPMVTRCGNLPFGSRLGGPGNKAVWSLDRLWDVGASIRIKLLDSADSAWIQTVRDRIQNISKTWCDYANITFAFVDADPSDLTIRLKPYRDGGYLYGNDGLFGSHIGRDCRAYANAPHSMNLIFPPALNQTSAEFRESEFQRLILHEFGHALGLLHEHQRPDRGIVWKKDEIERYAENEWGWQPDDVKNHILAVNSVENTFETPFDIHSIMMYEYPVGLAYYEKDQEPGVADLSKPFTSPRNTKLSAFDKVSASIAYPKAAPRLSRKILRQGGDPVAGTISQAGQIAPYEFRTEAAGTYSLTIGGTMPTLLAILKQPHLPGSRGLPNNLIAAGETDASSAVTVSWELPANRQFYLEVRHAKPVTGTGTYTISLSRQ